MVESMKNAANGYWANANDFTYNAAGAAISMQFGNGRWESTVFNSRLQPTQIALGSTNAATDLLKLNYTYNTTGNHDNNGNVLSQTITVPTVGSNNGFVAVQSYSYDPLNRLKDAVENVTPTGGSSSQSWKQEFSYDRYGNRNFVTGTGHTTTLGSCTTMCNPTFDATNNRITSSGFSFDSSGNTTRDAADRKFTYDAENKQTKAETLSAGTNTVTGTIGEYSYDGDGRRVKKYVPSIGETTIFVYDAAGKQIAEYSTVVASANDAKVAYLTADHLGSPRINTDETGAVISRHDYTGFGVDIAEAYGSIGGRSATQGYGTDDKVRQQYTGYQHDDESGLEYAQARSYNSSHGRFTSIDPLMASANVKNPQTLNRYSYVLNSPYKFVDPLGLISSSTGACGQWCQGSGPYSDSLSGRDANLDWMREYFGDVVGYVLDQPDGSSVVNGIVIPPRPIERPATTPLPPVPPPPPLMRTKDLFLKMWSNYPVISLGYEFGHDILLDSEGKPDPSNQCAVRFSYMAMLVLANQYNGMFNGSKKNGYAIKAEEIAAWLKHVFGYSYELTGPNIADQIKDRQGIVFLKNFPGADDGVGNLRFNHIDLWNGPSYRLGSTSERKYIDGAKNWFDNASKVIFWEFK